MIEKNRNIVLEFLKENPLSSSKEVFDGISSGTSYASLKRIISQLLTENLIIINGNGKATKYSISPAFKILFPINISQYFEKEIDERKITKNFNLELISLLKNVEIFTKEEIDKLNSLQKQFENNIKQLSANEYAKEMERLAIDLSWKSSQIEGNTYSLLETERLIKEKETAAGKTKDDAVMLLNHKDAIDFIVENTDYLNPISVSRIEDVHSILIKELGVDRNIRIRKVGISGTNYNPLDNEYQIREALIETCDLINIKNSVFEKALLALVLLSYIQPFADGNKRTARIISNAILIANAFCPISFRTIDSIEYKKAMLIFYEQNNINPIKQIFINQFEFAVNTYF
jgi:Fic family protein